MPAREIDEMITGAAAEVLERMFFTTPVAGPETASAQGSSIGARMSFHGNPSGRLGIRTPLQTGRKIAASFLGAEESDLSEAQIGEVICELANILCGSVLSRLEKESRFVLSPPAIEPMGAECPPDAAVSRTFGLEEGALVLWMELERAG